MKFDLNDFQTDVLDASHELPVLVDFWAEWCGPCKVIGPVLERLATEQVDRWRLVKVDTEAHPDLSQQFGIRGIPNVKMFINGEVADEFTGALPEPMIRQWLEKALPGEFDEKLNEAEQLIAAGEIEPAGVLLSEVLGADPANARAAILLAGLILNNDPGGALELVEGIEADSDFYEEALSVRQFALLFTYLEAPDSLPESQVKSRYLTSIERMKQENYAGALEGFIDVLTMDRKYDDDGARRACIAIFKRLGEANLTTQHYRKQFSQALYI